MAKTYEPIASTTLSAGTATVTFSSIPQTYTDLVLVVVQKQPSGSINNTVVRFNSDTGSNYSDAILYGNGSSAVSARHSATSLILADIGTTWSNLIVNIFNYTNTTTYKSVLSRYNSTQSGDVVMACVGTWRSTSAINSVTILTSVNFDIGSSFTLYGIKAS